MQNELRKNILSPRTFIIACIVALAAAAVAVGLFLYQQFKENEVILSDNLVIYEAGTSPFEILSMEDDPIVVSSMDGIPREWC